jgi:HEAT repeat protein
VRPGEGGTVSLVLGITFLLSAGGSIGGSAIEALFYSRQGTAALPVLYIALGLTTFVVSLAISAVLGRVPRTRVYLVLPLVLAASLAAQRAVLALDIPWTYALFWLLMNVEGSLQGMLAWGIAAIVCDTRQARRLFPLFAAGGISGGVVGGFATRPLAAAFGVENLLAVWAAALVLAFFFGRSLLARRTTRRARPRTSLADDVQAGFRHVRTSPLWRMVSAATVLFAILYFLVAFTLAKSAAAAYPDEKELAGFLGLFGGVSTGAAFLASLFLANRLFAKFGIMAAILVFPLIYAVGFGVLLLTQSTFAAVVTFRFTQAAYLQGVAAVAFESVFNVIPTERRDQVRAFVSGVPEQSGIVIAGAVLLVGDQVLEAGRLAILGFVVALLTAYVWHRASRQYGRALVRTLRAGQPLVFTDEDEPFGGFRQDATVVSAAVAAAQDPDARTRRVAIEILSGLDVASDTFVAALADQDADVRLAAASALARSDPEALGPSMNDAEPAVRAMAAAALMDTQPDARDVLDSFGDSHQGDQRLLAVRALAQTRNAGALERITVLASDEDARVRAAAVRALSAVGDAALPRLASAIRDTHRGVRIAAADALVAVGEPALDIVLHAIDDRRAQDHALHALRRLPSGTVTKPVRELARRHATEAVRYHRLARGMAGDRAERSALARDALTRASHRHAGVALGALAAVESGELVDAALTGLRSADPIQRANALETLDALNDREIVRPLLAIHEDLIPATPPTDLATLRDDPDPWVREVSVFATEPQTSTGGALMQTLVTMPTMERILFLRRVPLFAELPPEDLKQVAAVASEQLYEDGTVIARQGDVGDELLIIVDGEVRVVAGGDEIARRTKGDYIGEIAVLDGEPRMASLVASGSVRALSIGRRELETILRERPETSHAMLLVLARRLREATRGKGSTPKEFSA